MGNHEFIHTTARLAPGSSGGLGLAIPSSAVARLLTAGSPVELGVTVRPVRIPGPDPGIAWLVLGVTLGSPADYASLRIGDVLIGSGGRRFTISGDLQDALGDPKQREVTVRLTQGAAA
jgi:S1-C subfamily serine protease